MSFFHSMNIDLNVSTTNVYRIFTSDTKQQMSFSHFMNIDLSVSTSNIRRIFISDIEMQMSIKSPSTSISVHSFSLIQISEYRSNIFPNFSIFDSSLDYK